jgi:hypothetical protein
MQEQSARSDSDTTAEGASAPTDLIRSMAVSSAELWNDVLQRLAELQHTQAQLAKAVAELGGMVRDALPAGAAVPEGLRSVLDASPVGATLALPAGPVAELEELEELGAAAGKKRRRHGRRRQRPTGAASPAKASAGHRFRLHRRRQLSAVETTPFDATSLDPVRGTAAMLLPPPPAFPPPPSPEETAALLASLGRQPRTTGTVSDVPVSASTIIEPELVLGAQAAPQPLVYTPATAETALSPAAPFAPAEPIAPEVDPVVPVTPFTLDDAVLDPAVGGPAAAPVPEPIAFVPAAAPVPEPIAFVPAGAPVPEPIAFVPEAAPVVAPAPVHNGSPAESSASLVTEILAMAPAESPAASTECEPLRISEDVTLISKNRRKKLNFRIR